MDTQSKYELIVENWGKLPSHEICKLCDNISNQTLRSTVSRLRKKGIPLAPMPNNLREYSRRPRTKGVDYERLKQVYQQSHT